MNPRAHPVEVGARRAKRDEFVRKKHILLKQIMHDPALTASDKNVGFEICQHLNSDKGKAWPSEVTIAANLKINIKTVKRAIAALSGAPKKRGGPGRCAYFDVMVEVKLEPMRRYNTYVPRFGDLSALVSTAPPTSVQISALTPVLTKVAHGDKNGPTDGDKNGPIGGDITPSEDGDKNGPVSSLREPINYAETNSTAPASEMNARWLSVQKRMCSTLGAALVKSWFGQAKIISMNDTEVVIQMSSRFARDRVQYDLPGQRLTEAWRAELGVCVIVRLVDPPPALRVVG